MQNTKLYKLSWSLISKDDGKELKRGDGIYCGINVTDAQRDAVSDVEEFDDSKMIMVFDKDFIEFDC